MERRHGWEPTLILSFRAIDGKLPKYSVRPLLRILINGFRSMYTTASLQRQITEPTSAATNILMNWKLNKHA